MTNVLPWWRIIITAVDIDEIGPELYERGAQGIHELEPGRAEVFWQGIDPALMCQAVVELGGEFVSCTAVPIENWVQQASDQWEPISTGEIGITFLTEFSAAAQPIAEVVAPQNIKIVPGLGFGTGHHATTLTVLDLMQDVRLGAALKSQTQPLVLDLGTGSGILGIAAASLWSATVDAVEPDPLALENADQNCRGNGVTQLVRLVEGDISSVTAKYDVILANIYAEILVSVVDQMYARTKEIGWLILSGIMAEKADMVKAAYGGYEILREVELRGWVSFLLRRRN